MWSGNWTEEAWGRFLDMADLERSPPVWKAVMGFADVEDVDDF